MQRKGVVLRRAGGGGGDLQRAVGVRADDPSRKDEESVEEAEAPADE